MAGIHLTNRLKVPTNSSWLTTLEAIFYEEDIQKLVLYYEKSDKNVRVNFFVVPMLYLKKKHDLHFERIKSVQLISHVDSARYKYRRIEYWSVP